MSIVLKLWSLYVRATTRWPIIATIVPFIPVVMLWSIVADPECFRAHFFLRPPMSRGHLSPLHIRAFCQIIFRTA